MNISFSSLLLSKTFDSAFNDKKITKNELKDFILKSPLFQTSRYSIIEMALDFYFQKQFAIFSHLIIPQIEEALRCILEISSENVLTSSKSGGFHLKTFEKILREQSVIEILGEETTFHFRVLFTESRGINLRNNLFHGIISPSLITEETANLVLHALLCLGLVEEKKS